MMHITITIDSSSPRDRAIAFHPTLGPELLRHTVALVRRCIRKPYMLSADLPEPLRAHFDETDNSMGAAEEPAWRVTLRPLRGPLSEKRLKAFFAAMDTSRHDSLVSLIKPHDNCHAQWLRFLPSESKLDDGGIIPFTQMNHCQLQCVDKVTGNVQPLEKPAGSQWLISLFQADGCLQAHRNIPTLAEAKTDFVPYCPDSDKTLPLLFTMPLFGLDRDIAPKLDHLAGLGKRLFDQPRQQT